MASDESPAKAAPKSKWKKIAILSALVVILLLVGWQFAIGWWYRGFSTGSHSGVIRKLAVTGPPYCKALVGELSLQGAKGARTDEIWTFSADTHEEGNALMKELREAERTGLPVTLRYREDQHVSFEGLRTTFGCQAAAFRVTAVEH